MGRSALFLERSHSVPMPIFYLDYQQCNCCLFIEEGEVTGDVAGADRPFEFAGIGIAE